MKRSRDTILLFKTQPKERRQSLYRTVEYMALRGFHAWKIADVSGITISQVYTACRQMQIRLRDYRDGKGDVAKRIILFAKVTCWTSKKKKR